MNEGDIAKITDAELTEKAKDASYAYHDEVVAEIARRKNARKIGGIDTEGKTNDEIVAMLPEVHDLLEEVIGTYMDIAPEYKKMLIAWIMAAPYYQQFNAFPYLFINASKRSGKTRLLKLINAILPNSIMVVSMSESALFRTKGSSDVILIDEAERMHSRQKENLIDLLNAGYKKGGVVLRSVKDKKGNISVEKYDVYGPIALANIWGLDSVLESRCLTIVLQRTSNPAISNIAELFDFDPRITALNAYFEGSLVYVGSVVHNTYFNMVEVLERTLYNINILTLPTLTYTKIDSKVFLEAVQVGVGKSHISGRDLELYLPLFVTTYTASARCFYDLLDVANAQEASREEEDAEEDHDTNIAASLYMYLEREDRLVIKEFITYTGITDKWMSPEWVARFMKRAGIVKSRRRLGRGNEYEINKPALERYLKARGALDSIEKAPEAKEIDVKGNAVLCPECGKSTAKLYVYGSKTLCVDCLNAAQHAGDEM